MPRSLVIQIPRVDPQLLSERDAAGWMGVCQRTLWGLRASGEIPVVRVGRSIRYDLDDLRAYIAANKKGAAENA